MKKILMLLNFFFLSFLLNGQTTELVDIIYLKNGSIFKGKILEEDEDIIRFQLRDSESILILNPNGVKGANKNVPLNYYKLHRDKVIKINNYAFKEKGFYQSLSFFYMSELEKEEEEEKLQKGFGFNFVYGYRFNRWIGLGLGIGVDQYNIRNSDKIIPVFLNVNGFLNSKKMSPMYNIDVGYGLGLWDSDFLENIKTGLLFHPSFGFRLNSSSRSNVTLDAGLRFQEITEILFVQNFQDNFYQEETTKFARLTIRIGILF